MKRNCKNQPFLVLMQTSKAIQERIKEEMGKNKLNVTEFSVLEVLHFKGKQTIHQIGDSILISSGSMTYVIDKLEQKGLLRRIPCPEDRRVIHVILSDAGIELMEKIMPIHEESIDYMFGSLTGDEEQTLINLLQKVGKRVES
jgi:MarR family 2-MHQ and catechol resistance regulon transcriptional repressor